MYLECIYIYIIMVKNIREHVTFLLNLDPLDE